MSDRACCPVHYRRTLGCPLELLALLVARQMQTEHPLVLPRKLLFTGEPLRLGTHIRADPKESKPRIAT